MMPNFFIIGAQKAGTTSLYHYLTQHPQVYMSPVKEPCFFNFEIASDGELVMQEFRNPGRRKAAKFSNMKEYQSLFRGVTHETAIGEASPPYMYAPGTAERIKRWVPKAKIIAILRNPADRAYSGYLHAVRIGREPLHDFAEALGEEERRVHENWHYTFHYRRRGLYHAQLEPYYRLFGRDKIAVWLQEDLRDDPVGVAQSIYCFLGVDDMYVPDASTIHNPSGLPRNRISRTMIRGIDMAASTFLKTFTSASRIYPLAARLRWRIQSRIVAKPPPIDPEVRAELMEGYTQDILKLQELIGQDLSGWLKEESPESTRRHSNTLETIRGNERH
jgi:hypothetical protein